MNRRSLLLTAGAATLMACATSNTTPAARETPLAPEIDAAVARIMALGATPGMAVAVFTPEGAYTRGFGVTDVGTGERADADTAFYIASSTKPLTALALARLHHRGELDLDATLAAYAPDAPFPAAVRASEVRLRQMLSHTSGIDNGPIGFRSAFSGDHDPETLWRLLAASELNAEAPLGTFEYTNVGYNITTVLTDRRLGVRWQDLLDREVFTPAGMRRSSARMSRATTGGWTIAKPHESFTQGPQRISLEKTDQTMQSAGGVIMSANDAVRWLELMIRNGRIGDRQILAPEIVASTRERLTETSGDMFDYGRSGYGLGWYMGAYREQQILHHFGGFAGFAAHVSYNPASGVGVAAFSNGGSVGGIAIHPLANYIYDRTGGQGDSEARLASGLTERAGILAQSAQRVTADRANRANRQWTLTRPRAAYAGAYENETWGRIEVTADGETLTVRCGAMSATAEPFTQPDSIRVEMVPGSGEPIMFQGDGERPTALRNRVGVFQRV